MMEPKVGSFIEESLLRCRNLDVPLADRLQAFSNEVQRASPHFQAAIDAVVSRLAESDAGATAPKIGERMPGFLLPDEQGRLVRLTRGRSRWYFIADTGAPSVESTSTL